MRNYVLRELMKRAPDFQPSTIFDVGANVGQSVGEFREAYPAARVFAFEPVKASFDELAASVEGDENVRALHLGLSRSPGELVMTANGTSTGNRVLLPTERRAEVETVGMTSGDDFCTEEGIDDVGFLKIDAEGHDVEILVGFSGMLRERRVEYVQVECSFSPLNTYHVTFAQLSDFMFSFGYGLHGVFGLKRRMPRLGTRRGALFGDAVFVRDELVA